MAVADDMAELVNNTAAMDRTAATRYPGSIILFHSSEKIRDNRSDLCWDQIAAHGVDVHEIAGVHRALLRANVAEVGRRLKERLGQVHSDAKSVL